MKQLSSQTHITLSILFFAAIIICSCKKENSQTLTPEEEIEANRASTESNAEAEIVFNNLFDDVVGVNNDVGIAGTGIFGSSNTSNDAGGVSRTDTVYPCLTVSIVLLSNNPFPKKVIIDFGNGCLGRDGHFRKGKIITTYYVDRLTVPGASAVTEFQDFYIDSIHVEGRHEIANTTTGPTTYALHQFTVKIDAKLSKPNGNYTEWHSNKVITQFDGNLTPAITLDDAYKVTGNANGKVKRNNLLVAWRSEITEPLIKKFSCRWISKGKVRMVRETLSSNTQWAGILDYGAGNCDNQATLALNGVVYQITLH